MARRLQTGKLAKSLTLQLREHSVPPEEIFHLLGEAQAMSQHFRGFSEEDISTLVAEALVSRLAKGDLAVPEREAHMYFFIIVKGSIEVNYKSVDTEAGPVSGDRSSTAELDKGGILSPGTIFGDLAFFLPKSRIAARVTSASDETVLVTFNRSVLNKLKIENPLVCSKLVDIFIQSACFKITVRPPGPWEDFTKQTSTVDPKVLLPLLEDMTDQGLLENFLPADKVWLSENLRVLRPDAGVEFTHEGGEARHMFLLLKGEVEESFCVVSTKRSPSRFSISGTILGEEFFSKGARKSRLTATMPCIIGVFEQGWLQGVANSMPQLHAQLMINLGYLVVNKVAHKCTLMNDKLSPTAIESNEDEHQMRSVDNVFLEAAIRGASAFSARTEAEGLNFKNREALLQAMTELAGLCPEETAGLLDDTIPEFIKFLVKTAQRAADRSKEKDRMIEVFKDVVKSRLKGHTSQGEQNAANPEHNKSVEDENHDTETLPPLLDDLEQIIAKKEEERERYSIINKVLSTNLQTAEQNVAQKEKARERYSVINKELVSKHREEVFKVQWLEESLVHLQESIEGHSHDLQQLQNAKDSQLKLELSMKWLRAAYDTTNTRIKEMKDERVVRSKELNRRRWEGLLHGLWRLHDPSRRSRTVIHSLTSLGNEELGSRQGLKNDQMDLFTRLQQLTQANMSLTRELAEVKRDKEKAESRYSDQSSALEAEVQAANRQVELCMQQLTEAEERAKESRAQTDMMTQEVVVRTETETAIREEKRRAQDEAYEMGRLSYFLTMRLLDLETTFGTLLAPWSSAELSLLQQCWVVMRERGSIPDGGIDLDVKCLQQNRMIQNTAQMFINPAAAGRPVVVAQVPPSRNNPMVQYDSSYQPPKSPPRGSSSRRRTEQAKLNGRPHSSTKRGELHAGRTSPQNNDPHARLSLVASKIPPAKDAQEDVAGTPILKSWLHEDIASRQQAESNRHKEERLKWDHEKKDTWVDFCMSVNQVAYRMDEGSGLMQVADYMGNVLGAHEECLPHLLEEKSAPALLQSTPVHEEHPSSQTRSECAASIPSSISSPVTPPIRPTRPTGRPQSAALVTLASYKGTTSASHHRSPSGKVRIQSSPVTDITDAVHILPDNSTEVPFKRFQSDVPTSTSTSWTGPRGPPESAHSYTRLQHQQYMTRDKMMPSRKPYTDSADPTIRAPTMDLEPRRFGGGGNFVNPSEVKRLQSSDPGNRVYKIIKWRGKRLVPDKASLTL